MASLLGSLMKKPASNPAAQPATSVLPPAALPPEPTDELRLSLFRLIIARYREDIEEHENKSVSDLKAMILPHDPIITKTRDSLLESFRPYIYEEHFLAAAKMCCEYVASFATISPPVAFWLTIPDMLSIMAGDEIDKSILLCSLLRSLGSPDARIFVTSTKNSYVLCSFGGKFHLSAHSGAEPAVCGSEQEALLRMSGRPLYSFNDRDYSALSDEE
ncbi:MAG: hypothetical protein NTX79_01475 [Candidatus Micrarchaeota archaeon]|nr:hypothetical protein [Candidatus Micrarchaeota archaeon]